MKYISIDIETSGLDPEKCQVLSIGAAIEDTKKKLPLEEIPKFHAAIISHEISGEPFAINMNRELISRIVEWQTVEDKKAVEEKYNMLFLTKDEVVIKMWQWYVKHTTNLMGEFGKVENGKWVGIPTNKTKAEHITVAGKNVQSFDLKFLEKLPRWKQLFKARQRVIDPAILFTDWENDESLPGLSVCKQRAGLEEIVTHNADEDAVDVIRLLRKFY